MYYYGYIDADGIKHPGYVDLIDDLLTRFQLSIPRIVGEQNKREFIALFGAILRMRNILLSFDEFQNQQILSERDFQDYLGGLLQKVTVTLLKSTGIFGILFIQNAVSL